MLKNKRFPGLLWLLGVPWIFLLDQVTKWLILGNLSFGERVAVIPGLQFTLNFNRGIAFSLFDKQANVGQIALLVFIIFITIMVGAWLIKTPLEEKASGISLMFILGGALGNLFDRIWHGHVIDFIDLYYGNIHFYTFNLADSFITLGALIMIKALLFPSPALNGSQP